MTESETIEAIQFDLKIGGEIHSQVLRDAIDVAIQALEKQIPKKPITHSNTNRADCPCCGATVRGIKNPFGDWCSNCGQKLDFGGMKNE